MLDSNFELDEPLEAILQRPLTWFEKQQIQDKQQASADEAWAWLRPRPTLTRCAAA